MAKHLLFACLAWFAITVQAEPIVFFNTQFATQTIASGDAPADIQNDAGTSGATSGAASGTIDIATAGAGAFPGLLFTSADASASVDVASAVSTSFFSGNFSSQGPMNLTVNFSSFDFADGTGFAGASLHVLLKNDNAIVFDDYATLGANAFSYMALAGSTGYLELLLVSEASADGFTLGGGNASNLALVDFAGTVPLPATLWLLLLGIAALGVIRRGRTA